mgnify:CR=1 FL=1
MTEFKPNPINTPKTEWFIVYYGESDNWDWNGLKANDGLSRGVPEGPKSLWREIIYAIRNNVEFSEKRLAYTPGEGIYSPRNTNCESECFKVDSKDADLIEYLLNNPSSYRDDDLKGTTLKIN